MGEGEGQDQGEVEGEGEEEGEGEGACPGHVGLAGFAFWDQSGFGLGLGLRLGLGFAFWDPVSEVDGADRDPCWGIERRIEPIREIHRLAAKAGVSCRAGCGAGESRSGWILRTTANKNSTNRQDPADVLMSEHVLHHRLQGGIGLVEFRIPVLVCRV